MWNFRNMKQPIIFGLIVLIFTGCQNYEDININRISSSSKPVISEIGNTKSENFDGEKTVSQPIESSQQEELNEEKKNERETTNVFLTNLSMDMPLQEYTIGDSILGMEITNILCRQVCEGGVWKDLQVYVDFTGNLEVKGILHYFKDGSVTFTFSESSYPDIPALQISYEESEPKMGFPLGIYLDRELIDTLYTRNPQYESENVKIIFSKFMIRYGAGSSMSGTGEIVKIEDDKDISSPEESAGYTNNPQDGEGNSNEKTAEKSETIWDQYDIVYPAPVEGYVIVQRGLVHEVKQGLLKENGEIVLPVEYDFISSDLSEGLLTVQKNTKFGAVNLTGETVIPIEYEYLSKFSEGLAAFKQNGLWGYLNKKNETVINPVYQAAGNFVDGVAAVFPIRKEVWLEDSDAKIMRGADFILWSVNYIDTAGQTLYESKTLRKLKNL